MDRMKVGRIIMGPENKVEFTGGTLYFGEARGNSNVINEDSARITVKKGKGIVIISNGE